MLVPVLVLVLVPVLVPVHHAAPSEDDISDEDASDLFDTENVVVCQYDKITRCWWAGEMVKWCDGDVVNSYTRARNKWKFHLKDGVMNLEGKDYTFQVGLGWLAVFVSRLKRRFLPL